MGGSTTKIKLQGKNKYKKVQLSASYLSSFSCPCCSLGSIYSQGNFPNVGLIKQYLILLLGWGVVVKKLAETPETNI